MRSAAGAGVGRATERKGCRDVETEELNMSHAPPTVKAVQAALVEAIAARASDVLIEPGSDGLRVHYRIDGVLYPQHVVSEVNRFRPELLGHLKALARITPGPSGAPQDGRFAVVVAGRTVDVHLSVIPRQSGEAVVMRLVDLGAVPSVA